MRPPSPLERAARLVHISSMSALAPLRLLVCGFGPFPGMPDNPAAGAVEMLRAQRWAPAGAEVRYEVAPVLWDRSAQQLFDAAAAFAADAVLVVGVAASADRFRVECRAANRAALDRPDATGALHPTALIAPNGPSIVPAAAPIEALLAAVAGEGLPVERSIDAGDYLCNQVFYHLLTRAPAGRRTAFLHAPPVAPEIVAHAVKACAVALTLGLLPGGDAAT